MCLTAVVPGGFNYWSVYPGVRGTASHNDGVAASAPSCPVSLPTAARWLDIPPSQNFYPPMQQAGSEGFPKPVLQSRVVVGHVIMAPVTLPMPCMTEAREAWQWLQNESKPFYIDQLHLVKGWNSFAEMEAQRDSTIAAAMGTPFVPKPTEANLRTGPPLSGTKQKSLPEISNVEAASTPAASTDNLVRSSKPRSRPPPASQPERPRKSTRPSPGTIGGTNLEASLPPLAQTNPAMSIPTPGGNPIQRTELKEETSAKVTRPVKKTESLVSCKTSERPPKLVAKISLHDNTPVPINNSPSNDQLKQTGLSPADSAVPPLKRKSLPQTRPKEAMSPNITRPVEKKEKPASLGNSEQTSKLVAKTYPVDKQPNLTSKLPDKVKSKKLVSLIQSKH